MSAFPLNTDCVLSTEDPPLTILLKLLVCFTIFTAIGFVVVCFNVLRKYLSRHGYIGNRQNFAKKSNNQEILLGMLPGQHDSEMPEVPVRNGRELR